MEYASVTSHYTLHAPIYPCFTGASRISCATTTLPRERRTIVFPHANCAVWCEWARRVLVAVDCRESVRVFLIFCVGGCRYISGNEKYVFRVWWEFRASSCVRIIIKVEIRWLFVNRCVYAKSLIKKVLFEKFYHRVIPIFNFCSVDLGCGRMFFKLKFWFFVVRVVIYGCNQILRVDYIVESAMVN